VFDFVLLFDESVYSCVTIANHPAKLLTVVKKLCHYYLTRVAANWQSPIVWAIQVSLRAVKFIGVVIF